MADQRPSPLACVPCRRRHVKCDARMPICTRCRNSNSDCHYVRSRRGLRNRSSPDPPPGDVDLLPDFTTWLNNTIDLDVRLPILLNMNAMLTNPARATRPRPQHRCQWRCSL